MEVYGRCTGTCSTEQRANMSKCLKSVLFYQQEMAGLCLHYMEPHRREGDPYLEQANQTYLQVRVLFCFGLIQMAPVHWY